MDNLAIINEASAAWYISSQWGSIAQSLEEMFDAKWIWQTMSVTGALQVLTTSVVDFSFVVIKKHLCCYH